METEGTDEKHTQPINPVTETKQLSEKRNNFTRMQIDGTQREFTVNTG